MPTPCFTHALCLVFMSTCVSPLAASHLIRCRPFPFNVSTTATAFLRPPRSVPFPFFSCLAADCAIRPFRDYRLVVRLPPLAD